jgi:hypothetical protein
MKIENDEWNEYRNKRLKIALTLRLRSTIRTRNGMNIEIRD